MTTRTTRSILVGALAAGLLLTAPLAAGAAVPAQVSSVLYEGDEIPSTKAQLTRSGSIKDGVPVYSEPASSGMTMTHLLPRARAVGGLETVKFSDPFTAHNEKWVAILVPDAAHGTDDAKSTLAEAGVGYVRASTVTVVEEVPVSGSKSFPSTKSDLVTVVELTAGRALYRQPIESLETALNKGTPVVGIVLKSSSAFEYNGRQWIAVEMDERVIAGGIAYILVDEKSMTVRPAEASATAAPTAGPTVSSAPTAEPTVSPAAPAQASPATPEAAPLLAEPGSDAFTKVLANVPATIFAAMVMAGTLLILKRRTA